MCQLYLHFLLSLPALAGRMSKKEGILRNDPQQAAATTSQACVYLLICATQNNDKSKYLGPGLFWSDKFQPASKIRESVGCTRLGASCRRSLSGSYSVLFLTVAALETCILRSPRVCPRVQTPDWWWGGSNQLLW